MAEAPIRRLTDSYCGSKHLVRASRREPSIPGAWHEFVSRVFAEDLHAKRAEARANAATRALEAAPLSIGVIGPALAAANSNMREWLRG